MAQTLGDLEIIIVDDGSSDRTAAIAFRLAREDRRVHLLHHAPGRGVSAARNTAIAAAQGDWLAILDADDWFAPDRLGCLIADAEARSLDVVIDNLEMIDSSTGTSLGHAFPFEWMAPRQPVSMSFLVEHDIPGRQAMGFGYCKPVVRRATFTENVGGYHEGIRCAEDALVLQKLLFSGARVGTIERPMYFYSVDPHSSSNRPGVNIDVAKVNRLIMADAKRIDPGMLSLLNDRRVIIEYDALRKAVIQRYLGETMYFLWHIPKLGLALQLAGGARRRLGRKAGSIRSGQR